MFINVPVRPPAEKWVKVPKYKKIINFAKKIHEGAEITYLPSLSEDKKIEKFEEIIEAIKRRPYEFEEIKKLTCIEENVLKEMLEKEIKKGNILREKREGREFYYYRKSFIDN